MRKWDMACHHRQARNPNLADYVELFPPCSSPQVGFADALVFFLLPHIMAGNGTMPPAIDEAGAFLLATSSTLSLVGDLGIIIAFASSSEARRLTTTRMIAFLAMADLVGEVGVRASRAQQPCPFLFFHR